MGWIAAAVLLLAGVQMSALLAVGVLLSLVVFLPFEVFGNLDRFGVGMIVLAVLDVLIGWPLLGAWFLKSLSGPNT